MTNRYRNEQARSRRFSFSVLLAILVAASGCSGLEVETLAAPGANLSQNATFRIIDSPIAANVGRTTVVVDDVRPAAIAENVMLNNSIIDQIARNDVARAFQARGYAMTEDDPDFLVSYFVIADEVFEIENFNDPYYDNYYRYRDCCYVDEYTEGTVVVDVIDPDTKKLLWRGSGVAPVSDDPNKYQEQVREAVNEIVRRFPAAYPTTSLAPSENGSGGEGY